MDAPDGGTDTLLPALGHAGYQRGWQAKRYTGNIAWSKCKESLDRAVETYEIRHLTFCFSRNLTVGQEKLFVKHLVGRHAGVAVDYWNGSELTARLTGTEEGRRVARHFFGDRDVLERIERSQRAGGPLTTEADAHERLFAVGDFMAAGDPYFAYTTSVGEVATPAAEPPERTIMSVERVRGEVRARTDVIPRDQDAVDRYGPRGRLLFSPDETGRRAHEAVQRALREGGEVQVDAGVSATWDQMPPMFADMVGKTIQGTVRIVASRPVAPWVAQVTAETDLGSEVMEFDLSPVDPTPEWDFALAGTSGGLTLMVRGRWREPQGHGEVNIGWSHTVDVSRPAEQARGLALLKALHGSGHMVIEDLTGGRPPVEQELSGVHFPEELSDLQVLFEAVALIEGRAGIAIEIPDTVSVEEANQLAIVAACVRDGGQDVRFRSMQMVVAPDSPVLRDDPVTGVTVEHNLDARVFGHVVGLGRTVCTMPPLRVVNRESPQDGTGVLVTLAPATGEPADIRVALRQA
jgi:hypothetical protein